MPQAQRVSLQTSWKEHRMTIQKLQLIRRMLLDLVAIIDRELSERGATSKTIKVREIQHW
jgi:hypothetical protein